METTAVRARVCHHIRLPLTTTRATTLLDVTELLERFVADVKVRTGTVTVQTLHTTTALIVNELEPLLHQDFVALFDRLAPAGSVYLHDDMSRRVGVPQDEPRNGHAHCRALLLPTSVSLTVAGGRLVLGRWQRTFFVELDGPRCRELSVVIVGEADL